MVTDAEGIAYTAPAQRRVVIMRVLRPVLLIVAWHCNSKENRLIELFNTIYCSLEITTIGLNNERFAVEVYFHT